MDAQNITLRVELQPFDHWSLNHDGWDAQEVFLFDLVRK